MALLTELSWGRVSAFGFPGFLIRDVDATGSGMARLRRRVSCLWTGQERFYGARVRPGWYQTRSSVGPGGRLALVAVSAIRHAYVAPAGVRGGERPHEP